MSKTLRVIVVCFTVLLVTSIALAQGIVTGSISGTVVDEQQAVITGAQVKAVQNGTNQEFKAVTDAQGFFAIHSLPIGTYTVTISAPNFTTSKVTDVTVASGATHELGASALKIGTANDVVTVEAKAAIIESQSSQVTSTFDTAAVQKLPNAGTGFDNLALYIPGVANNGVANFSNTNGASFSSNGLRGRSNNFQIDGQSNNDNSIAGPSIFLSRTGIYFRVGAVRTNSIRIFSRFVRY